MAPKFLVNARFLEASENENNGIFRFERELSLRLKAFDSRIQFLSSRQVECNSYTKALQPISFGRFRGAIWEQLELPLFVQRKFKGYYLVNLNNISPVLYNKNISAVHDLNWKHLPETFELKSRLVLSTLMPLVIRRAKRILTVSNFSKNDLLKSYNLKSANIKVLYNGISGNFIAENGKSITEQKLSDYGITRQQYFLASIKKNPEQLIKAFKLLNRPGIKLVFFGKVFKSFEHVMPEIESSDNIVYLGKISDTFLYHLYTNATALVFPSMNEGFGIPLLEAMNCQCPVITSNLSSMPEVCGDAALFIDPYNVNDLADKMDMLCTQDKLRSDLIKKGSARVQYFSFDKTAVELMEYLKNIGLYN